MSAPASDRASRRRCAGGRSPSPLRSRRFIIGTCTVRFYPQDRLTQVETGTYISDAALAAGVDVQLPCGGQGRCGRCLVIVQEGQVTNALSQRQIDLFGDDQLDLARGQPVLACQSTIQSDAVIYVPEEKIERKLETDKTAQEIQVPFNYNARRDQPLRKVVVAVTEPSMDDQTDDWSRVQRELARQHGIEGLVATLGVLQKLATALRVQPPVHDAALPAQPWTVTLVIEMDRWDAPNGPPRLVDVLPGEQLESLWGAAIDIGTTTNVVWLVDLLSGEVMAQTVDYNGQITRGEDVISRIVYAARGQDETGSSAGLLDLQDRVRQTLNRLLDQAAAQVGTRPQEIYSCSIAGNSTMIHLLAGLQPQSIRLAPFITTINQLPSLQAHELGLNLCPSATVDCLPGVASYVGADITAGVLSTGLSQSDQLSLFIDVGTNGEIVLGDSNWLITCACSAGPAFEGAGVLFGMRATEGAIEDVWIHPQTYEPTIRVIGRSDETSEQNSDRSDVVPQGICGSGLIALLSELFTTGVINKSGHVDTNLPTKRVRTGAHGGEYVLVWGHERTPDRRASADLQSETDADDASLDERADIVFTDVDADNLMRAKAAIYAGFAVLAKSVGLTIGDIDRTLIGGAFGQYINIEKAIQIGLLPDAPWESFYYMGNTSVRGAYLTLLSREARQQIIEIAGQMTYLELSADNSFFEEFQAALFLPHTDESQFPNVVAPGR